jgi:transposase InsO family protein
MHNSHNCPQKPSPLVALVCLAVVSRHRRDWLAVDLRSAAADCGVGPQRLSRLCSRAIAPFEAAVARLCRIGRPPVDHDMQQAKVQNTLLSALLDTATSLLSQRPVRSPLARALVVGAWLRLHTEHPSLTQKRFCAALSVPERTFRNWLGREPSNQPAVPKTSAPKPDKPPKRPVRRGRFSFAVTVPDTQLAADTTDLCAFGVPLKLMAAQDVGGRDIDLFDAVIVDDHESAELVARLLAEALAGQPGQQVLTDQGTPYMAQAARDALDELAADHAPQREGDPLGKATIERAFGTLKQIARPLLSVTNTLADTVASLRNVRLAKALTTVLLTALLKAYQAGARASRRAAEARTNLDEQTLARVAHNSRQRAHAEQRSARLLLTHLHMAYQFDTPVRTFIRIFRRFPLPVLRQAERAFGAQAHRGDIRHRTAYFAAIVRRLHDEHRRQRAREQRDRTTLDELKRREQAHQDQLRRWEQRPEVHLQTAIQALLDQVHPLTGELLFGGVGLGRLWLRQSLSRLATLHGPRGASHLATGIMHEVVLACRDKVPRAGIEAVTAMVNRHLDDLPKPAAKDDCGEGCVSAIFDKYRATTAPGPSPRLRT